MLRFGLLGQAQVKTASNPVTAAKSNFFILPHNFLLSPTSFLESPAHSFIAKCTQILTFAGLEICRSKYGYLS